MEIEEFIRECVRQIYNSCDIVRGEYHPKSISFSIKVNEDGKVCEPPDYVSATIEVEIWK